MYELQALRVKPGRAMDHTIEARFSVENLRERNAKLPTGSDPDDVQDTLKSTLKSISSSPCHTVF